MIPILNPRDEGEELPGVSAISDNGRRDITKINYGSVFHYPSPPSVFAATRRAVAQAEPAAVVAHFRR